MKEILKITLFFYLLLIQSHIEAQTIFVYNPEARGGNLSKVKSDLEAFLSKTDITGTALIFANSEDFEQSIKRLKPDAAVVASYYYFLHKKDFAWQAALAGLHDDQPRFQKIMVTASTITDIAQLKNQSLATVSLGFSAAYIDSMLPPQITSKDMRVVSVSKDIDAIMALAFGQVQAAIVTEASFEKLKSINPDAVKNLKILQKLNPIPYPKLVFFPNANNPDKLKDAFLKMNDASATNAFLKYMGITLFKKEN